jgi:hypothetical protein
LTEGGDDGDGDGDGRHAEGGQLVRRADGEVGDLGLRGDRGASHEHLHDNTPGELAVVVRTLAGDENASAVPLVAAAGGGGGLRVDAAARRSLRHG